MTILRSAIRASGAIVLLVAPLLCALAAGHSASAQVPPAAAQAAAPLPPEPQPAPFTAQSAPAPGSGDAETQGESLPPQEDIPPPDLKPVPRAGQGKQPMPPPPPPVLPSGPVAVVLQGLDKVTARISTIEVPVGGQARFGSLTITARACQKSPPDEPPEAAAFLEIVEQQAAATPAMVFTGWMFASSPALSALEHPVYDVWVKDCKAIDPASP